MNKVEGLWEDVLVGFFVQDLNRKWWKVLGILPVEEGGGLVLEDADKRSVIVPAKPGHTAVTYLYEPKTLIEQTLDGKEIT